MSLLLGIAIFIVWLTVVIFALALGTTAARADREAHAAEEYLGKTRLP